MNSPSNYNYIPCKQDRNADMRLSRHKAPQNVSNLWKCTENQLIRLLTSVYRQTYVTCKHCSPLHLCIWRLWQLPSENWQLGLKYWTFGSKRHAKCFDPWAPQSWPRGYTSMRAKKYACIATRFIIVYQYLQAVWKAYSSETSTCTIWACAKIILVADSVL